MIRGSVSRCDVPVTTVGQVQFTTPAGQTVLIRPVAGPQQERLEEWDTFTSWVLDAAEERELEQLREDSW